LSSFCLGCGNSLSEGDTFCAACGRSLSATASAPVDPAVAFGLPPEISGKAIFSLVCSLFGIFPPAAAVAVIFGHLSLSEIKKNPARLTGRGLAITGLVFGYAGVAMGVVWLVLIGIAIPKAIRAERTQKAQGTSRTPVTVGDQGVSAVSVVRSMNTAEIAYAQAHPAAGYTCSLSDLSDTWGIGDQLDRAKKNGYTVDLQACAGKNPGGPITHYRIVAYPLLINQHGKPAFCSNESDQIKVARNGSIQDCIKGGRDVPPAEINHPEAWSQNSSH
jgi:hypothetical protein